MLTKKQQEFFNLITKYYKENKKTPTIGILKKNSNYKSYNTIYKYLAQLEKKEFIKLDKKDNKITYIKKQLENNLYTNIPIINNKTFIEVSNKHLKYNQEYVAFKLNNNKLNNYYLKTKDILIIEKNLNNLNNKFVLVLIENNYQVFKYLKKDGFIHLLNDKQCILLTTSITIIGKVIMLIRNTMD